MMKFSAGGASIQCPCCGYDSFEKDYRQLNSRGASFLGLDWANKNATILICQRCSHIAWFMHEPLSSR